MALQILSALIVDDDAITRRTVGFALNQENFNCSYAADGADALQRLAGEQFDLVVTDLRMPNRHGHSLAKEVLSHKPSPVVVIHTSIDDPRLTKDLMLMGVDDIVYKPTNYAAFAAKFKGLVLRRKQSGPSNGKSVTQTKVLPELVVEQQGAPNTEAAPTDTPVASGMAAEQRATRDSKAIPTDISNASSVVNSVFLQSKREDVLIPELAATITLDAVLTAEILRLANSGDYSRNHSSVSCLEEAIVRIGLKKVGEIALNSGGIKN